MGLGIRFFIFDDDSKVTRIPQERFLRIVSAEEPYPAAAGKYLRYAEVVVDFENREPVAIVRMLFSKLDFDENGLNRVENDMRLTPDLVGKLKSMQHEPEFDNVVDFIPRWAEKEKKKRKWIPKPRELQALREYFPGLI